MKWKRKIKFYCENMRKKRMFSWMNPKLEVRETGKYNELDGRIEGEKKIYEENKRIGKGIFAKDELKKGETLFVMGGYILTIEEEDLLEGELADKPIEISNEFSIGPRSFSDLDLMPEHYVNHSCNPNAGFKGNIFMVAMRNINKDEEIVYDYAMVMNPNAKSKSFLKFKCCCGSAECRKIISENDWENTTLQDKYNGYFQYFLEERIKRIKKLSLK